MDISSTGVGFCVSIFEQSEVACLKIILKFIFIFINVLLFHIQSTLFLYLSFIFILLLILRVINLFVLGCVIVLSFALSKESLLCFALLLFWLYFSYCFTALLILMHRFSL